MSEEQTKGRTRFVLSSIAAERQKKKKKRNQGEPSMVDSFLKRFTTRRKQCAFSHQANNNDATVVIENTSEDENEPYTTIVVPDGDFLLNWLTVVSVAVVYNLWVLIARQAWPELQDKSRAGWFIADYFCDIIYILDMVVQARTAYLEEGLLVTDRKKLLCNYVKSRKFIVDLLSLLPTDLFYLLDTERLNPIVRCPRFLRVYRFYSWYVKVETRTHLPNTFRVLYLTHILLLGLHWTGAAYFLICEALGHGFTPEIYYSEHGSGNSTLALKYLASFYWSTLTLTTIGDLPAPHNETEYVVQIVGYLVGIFIFATVVGQVGNIIGNHNATRMEFERQVDHAKRYMRSNNVPRDVQLRVLRWYDYTRTRGIMHGRCDVNALGLLPDTHRTELALHVNLQTLKKVSILKVCPPEFLHDLVLKMHLCIFTPGDPVCKKGAVAREMFIVSAGLFKVTDESGKVVSTLKSGDFFGEIGILNLDGRNNRRTADVYSVGFSELFSLSKDDVLGVLKDYPDVKSVIEEEGRRKLESLLSNGTDRVDDGMKIEGNTDRVDIHPKTSGSNSHIRPRVDPSPVDETKRTGTPGRYAKAKNRTSSTSSGLSEMAMKDIGSVKMTVLEKNDSSAEDAGLEKVTNIDTRQTIWVLQQENESRAAYIRALEQRNKELQALLNATSPFQTSDA